MRVLVISSGGRSSGNPEMTTAHAFVGTGTCVAEVLPSMLSLVGDADRCARSS